MDKVQKAIIEEALSTVSFSNIVQALNSKSQEEKDLFAVLCRNGNPKVAGILESVCREIAMTKAQTKIDQITSDGVITVDEMNNILQRLIND